MLELGRLGKPFGTKGEIKAVPHNDTNREAFTRPGTRCLLPLVILLCLAERVSQRSFDKLHMPGQTAGVSCFYTLSADYTTALGGQGAEASKWCKPQA